MQIRSNPGERARFLMAPFSSFVMESWRCLCRLMTMDSWRCLRLPAGGLCPPSSWDFLGHGEERIANLLARFLVLAPAFFNAVNLPKSKIPRENEG
jgi:hypothetical protein